MLLIALSDARAHTHTHTHTHGRTTLDEDRSHAQTCTCTTHNTQKRRISMPQPVFEPAIPSSEQPLRSVCLKPAKEKYFSFCNQRFGVTCCLHNVFVNTETAGFSKTPVTQLQTTACYTNQHTLKLGLLDIVKYRTLHVF